MTTSANSTASANTCSLHIRLFDGRSIRSKFSADSTLTTAVRTFVDANASSEIPYSFRLMDLPRPARTIEISEENQSLRELGLCPNATLVLVPVKDFTDAYASNGSTVAVYKGWVIGWSMFQGAVDTASSFLSGLAGYSADQAKIEGPYVAGTGDSTGHSLASNDDKRSAGQAQKGKQPAEFYNGNTTNVEPRPDGRN